jgi:hypothetical protein
MDFGFHCEDKVFDVSVWTRDCHDCQIGRDARVRPKPEPFLEGGDEARRDLHGAVQLAKHGLRQFGCRVGTILDWQRSAKKSVGCSGDVSPGEEANRTIRWFDLCQDPKWPFVFALSATWSVLKP